MVKREQCSCCRQGGCMSGCSCYIDPPGWCVNCNHKEGNHKEDGCSQLNTSGQKVICSCQQYEGPENNG